ncbi:unnamed protein product [Mytilus edulis]|uniref:Uncharacterized protein n=1 Tax=Mytilus edulis TaxID=6550 RepID=A0A8S3QNC8_MYTED|nr:unnamed protein product [Mytilus edulis]
MLECFAADKRQRRWNLELLPAVFEVSQSEIIYSRQETTSAIAVHRPETSKFHSTNDEPVMVDAHALSGAVEDGLGTHYSDYVVALTMNEWPQMAKSFINRDRHGWPKTTTEENPLTRQRLEIEVNTKSKPRGQHMTRRPMKLFSPKYPTKIGTWNVRTLYQSGKSLQTAKEMDRYSIEILGLSEVRWNTSGMTTLNTGQRISSTLLTSFH